jgi:transcriptional regulator GlxA family with amidase domain
VHIAFLIPAEPTAQDFVGPWEVFTRWPSMPKLSLVATSPGMVECDSGITINVANGLDDVAAPDIVIVPGGSDPLAAMSDQAALAWLRTVALTAKWIGSVCTGSGVLAAAGLLGQRPVATHWVFSDSLRQMGVNVVDDRVVVADNIITSAGITAGIDMALTLTMLELGEPMASAVQLALEYDPKPPTDSGSPLKARPEVRDLVYGFLSAGLPTNSELAELAAGAALGAETP